MTIKIFKAPEKTPSISSFESYGRCSIFLAGSIEMGSAEDWQQYVTNSLAEYNVDIFNPRRDDWDSSWKQEIDDPQFNEQVNWELDHINEADIIFLYFSPETKSPISLLELGTIVESNRRPNRNIIICPDGFYRKGNVDIVCYRKGIKVFASIDEALVSLKKAIDQVVSIRRQ